MPRRPTSRREAGEPGISPAAIEESLPRQQRPGITGHTCNAWCVGEVHVGLALVSAKVQSPEHLLRIFAQPLRRLRRRELLSARRAGEVDKNTVIAQFLEQGRTTVTSRSRLKIATRASLEQCEVWVIYSRHINS